MVTIGNFIEARPTQDTSGTAFFFTGAGLMLLIAVLLAFFGSKRETRKVDNYDTSMFVLEDTPQPSKCGSYALIWDLSDDMTKLAVNDAHTGERVYTSVNLKPKGTPTLLWGNELIIWYHDSMVGLRYWARNEGGDAKWMEGYYTKGPDSPPPPRVLLHLYPELYL